ncbi:hypothetical protein [Natronoarchaeum rubrum]|uniref:hypothetical protein n=1 Tax=Natronoarchaeum rubrum TaxID=755311 RepID=UPI0021132B37|nr:hypothetical protein [Natronoarchaeum rubrum]
MFDLKQQWSKVTLAGAIVGIVGSLGPWISWDINEAVAALASIEPEATEYGFQGDGLITLAMVLAVAILVVYRDEELIDAAVSAVLGLAVLGFGVMKYNDLISIIGDIPSELQSEVQVSAGIGLYLVILGGTIIAAGGIYGVVQTRRAEAESTAV